MKKKLLVFILISISIHSQAQKLEWNIDFKGIGDNREFNPTYAKPQTIIGERTSFELGTTLDSLHSFRIGLSHFYEFGTDISYNKPQLTAYYKYDDQKTQLYFGAFPRFNLIDFPLAIIADTVSYYRPNIEGVLIQHKWNWGKQLIFVDWTGKQLVDQREQFMAGTSGIINLKNFYVENFLMMYHYALMAEAVDTQHIIDNTALNVNLGYHFTMCKALSAFYIEAGILSSEYRERNISDGFEYSNSFLSTAFLEWKRLSIKNTLSIGKGHQILTGDTYYNANSYMRTDLFFNLIKYKNVTATFNMSFHSANWETLDSQQQLFVIFNLGNN